VLFAGKANTTRNTAKDVVYTQIRLNFHSYTSLQTVKLMNSKPIFINIIGSGSMGHLWASYLLKNLPENEQANITLYGKRPQKTFKLQVQTPQQTFNCAISHKSLNQWQPADYIIICVKATALEQLCYQLAEITLHHPPVLLMMNGMGIIEIAKRALPNTIICQASTNHGAQLDGARLCHTGTGQTLIGQIDGSNTHQFIFAPLIEQLDLALPTTTWNTKHLETLWTKLIVNSIINPLTTIHQVTNGALIDDSQINQQAETLVRELSPIIEKYLPKQTWQGLFEKVESIANQTYTNISSMRQDIIKGRKTEIEFISTYLIKTAKELNLELPKHKEIINEINKLERLSHTHT